MHISQFCWQSLIVRYINTGVNAVPFLGYDTYPQLSEAGLCVFQIVLQL